MRVTVGEGGVGTDSGSGVRGGDTYIEAVAKDGSVVEVMRASGGEGGVGPQGAPDFDVDRARSTVAFFANHVEVRDDLAYVLGGGWDHYKVEAFPGVVSGGLVVLVGIEQQVGAVATMEICVLMDAGEVQSAEAVVPIAVVPSVPTARSCKLCRSLLLRRRRAC